MTPREALYDALDAAYLEGWNRAKANNHSAHDLMDIVPEEARWLCDADWRLWQEEARRYAENADYWRKRCAEAYADAARIARELATHPAELMSRHEIADAIAARLVRLESQRPQTGDLPSLNQANNQGWQAAIEFLWSVGRNTAAEVLQAEFEKRRLPE